MSGKTRNGVIKVELLYFIGGLTLGLLGLGLGFVLLRRGGGEGEIGARFIDGLRELTSLRALGTLTGSRREGEEGWYLNIRGYGSRES